MTVQHIRVLLSKAPKIYPSEIRKTIRGWKVIVVLMALWSISCKERFDPPAITAASNYLVVEGLINTGQGPTNFNLSRTLKLADSAAIHPEQNARVTVEGNDHSIYPLQDSGNGSYTADQLYVNNNAQYRLHIITYDGKEYYSDFVPVKQTPDIDSISWKKEEAGVRIFVNTHDPQNATRYYKWNFNETWEIHSPFPSNYRYENGDVILDYNQRTSVCWKYHQSSTIVLGSSVKLQNDVIQESPVLLIPDNDEKLSVRYSILIRQYALDKKAYSFYEIMKKNTESLGSIFDAQPTEISGNIHNTADPNEIVIGYVSAANVTEKRIFINNSELSDWRYRMYCETTVVPNNTDSFKYFYPRLLLPYAAKQTGPTVEGYYSSSPECVDCTLRGSNIKPSYW